MLLLGSFLLLPPSLEAARDWIAPDVPYKDPSRPAALSRPPSSPCPEQGPGCSAGEHHSESHSEHLPENQRGGFATRPRGGSGSPSWPKACEAGRDLGTDLGADLRALLGRTGAKYSRPEFVGEEESRGTRRGEGLQRGAELPGKEKETLKEKEKEKERRREKGVHQSGNYRFKDSGIGNSWLLGNDTTSHANAYVNGMDGCEENLTIPYELTDENLDTKYVEVIGQYAFYTCGDKDSNGRTRLIVLSRYIKVIKRGGLGAMHDVTSFEIEEGSCLESIEAYGLSFMSFENRNESERRSILVLPSTVTSIAENGLHRNNLIKTIYYCGSTHLSNYSALEYGVSNPDIKVTSLYTHNSIFGKYKPNRSIESSAEAEEKCKSFAHKPETTATAANRGCSQALGRLPRLLLLPLLLAPCPRPTLFPNFSPSLDQPPAPTLTHTPTFLLSSSTPFDLLLNFFHFTLSHKTSYYLNIHMSHISFH